jgi:hypothetical protein
MTTVPLRAAAAGACLAVAMSACVAPGLASPSPSGPDASAPPAVVTPSPSPVVTPTPSPASDILVHVIPASADVPFGYVSREIMRRRPDCNIVMVEVAIPDYWSEAMERAALARSGDGLVSEHPPAYVGELRAAAKAFGGFEVFVQQSANARQAWVVRLGTAADEPAQAPPGSLMAVGMFRHELPDGRTAWVLSQSLVALEC